MKRPSPTALGAVERDRLFSIALDLLCVVGADGYFRQLNRAWERTFGLSAAELRSRPMLESVHPADRMATAERLAEVRQAEGQVSWESRFQHADGSYRWLSWCAMPAAGEDLMYAAARDVTDQHDQAEALFETEAGFDLVAQALARQNAVTREQLQLLDMASDAVVVRDMDGRIAFWNRAAERLYGWKREEVMGGSTQTFLQTKFPVPYEQVQDALLSAGRWEGELVHATRDGSRVIVASRWGVHRDDDGKPIATLEINTDITEAKWAQDAVRASEARFRAIFEGAAMGIALVDTDGRVRESNPVLQHMLGWSGYELQGMPFLEFSHPEDAETDHQLYAEMASGVRGSYQVEKRLLSRDGRTLWTRVTVSLVRAEGQEPEYTIWMIEDVRLALIDDLTGLNNRRALISYAHQQMKLASRERRRLTLLFVDIDGMKSINDKLGHAEGDRAIIDTARVLTATFRESDFIARIGGDEFCVLMGGESATAAGVKATLARLQKMTRAHNQQSERLYKLSLSAGAASHEPGESRSISELLEKADRAMYEQKVRRLKLA